MKQHVLHVHVATCILYMYKWKIKVILYKLLKLKFSTTHVRHATRQVKKDSGIKLVEPSSIQVLHHSACKISFHASSELLCKSCMSIVINIDMKISILYLDTHMYNVHYFACRLNYNTSSYQYIQYLIQNICTLLLFAVTFLKNNVSQFKKL